MGQALYGMHDRLDGEYISSRQADKKNPSLWLGKRYTEIDMQRKNEMEWNSKIKIWKQEFRLKTLRDV